MPKHELFWLQTIVLTTVAVANTIAVGTHLYWTLPWIDIPMHFAGGVWIGLITLWVFFYSPFLSTSHGAVRMFTFAVLGTLVVGLGWEFLGLVIHVPVQDNYSLDTATDLLMDVCGGIAAWALVRWRYE